MRHLDAFGDQQLPLEGLATAVAAESSAGRDHTMAGDVGPVAAAHDVADRAVRSRVPGQGRHVAVGRDAAARNATHDGENASRKGIVHCTPSLHQGQRIDAVLGWIEWTGDRRW
jgi:hypothetical protein